MIENISTEKLVAIVNRAPKGAEYFSQGYDVEYRKIENGRYFGFVDCEIGWMEAKDFAVAKERIDKGYLLGDLIDEIARRKETEREEVEWVNGDKCIYEGALYDYQCVSSWDKDACVLSGASPEAKPFTDAWIDELSKPETPEQKEQREWLESGYDLYCSYQSGAGLSCCAIENFHKQDLFEIFMFSVKKTGYRCTPSE